jgi:predicted aspartyl protease
MKTKLRICGLLMLAGGLLDGRPVNGAPCRVTPVRCADAGTTQTIPVKIYRNFLVVAEGQLGGVTEPQNFVIDTGTSPSVLNERVIRQMGLATAESTISGLGKTVTTRAAVVPEIGLGPIVAKAMPVRVRDMSRVERDLGITIAGIIGLDVLSRSSFRLDYGSKQIEFGDEVAEGGDGIPVSVDVNLKVAVAAVRIGERTVRMLVDTGSDRMVLLGGNFSEAGWLTLRNTSQTAASLVDPKMELRVFSAPDIRFGEQHFSKDQAYWVPGAADPLFDGLLGVRALGFQGVAYDRASGTVYLQK